MPQTVVVPVPPPARDPERVAEAALPYARALATRTGARIVLATAIDDVPSFDAAARALVASSAAAKERWLVEAQVRLDHLATEFAAGTVATVVRWGHPVDALLAVLAEYPDPVLVLASHARQGLARLVAGSVAFELVHVAPCPVLVVRGPRPAQPDLPTFATVLVPLDRSAVAEHALDAALAALGPADGRVHLLHVVEPFATPEIPTGELVEIVRHAARRYLETTAGRVAGRGYRVTSEVRYGKPAAEIARVVSEQGVDLIAMTTHGRSGISRVLFGSVAERLLHEATVPLLLVRPDEAALAAASVRTAEEAAAHQPAREAAPPALWSQRASEVMTAPAIVARESTPLAELVATMLAERIGCVPVVDERGQLVGIVTESDFLGADPCVPLAAYQVPQCFRTWLSEEALADVYAAGQQTTAGQVMSHPVVTATEEEPVGALVSKLLDRGLKRLPVVRDGVPVGVVTRHDLLALLQPAGT